MAAFFSDTFTEASVDTTLASHAPDVGTSWTRIYNDGSGPSFSAIAATDRCKMASGNNSGMVYTADVTYPSADYEVVFTIVGGPTTNADRPLYVFVRLQDIENMYAVKIMYTGTLSQLYTKVSGTWTAVGSAFTAPATGSVCKLEIIGTALKFYDDGAEVASATVTDISAAGKAGLGGGGGSELVLSTDDCNSTWEIDALSVTDLGAGGTTYNQSAAGSLTSAGTIAKLTATPKSGALTSSGALAKLTLKTLAGSLASAGALVRLTATSLSGTLTTAGAALKLTAKTFAGDLASSGALAAVKVAVIALGGTLSSSGALVRQTGKAVAGALSSDGALARAISKTLAGTLAPAGALAKLTTKTFAGALTGAGALLAEIVGAATFYLPGTRLRRKARARGTILSVAPDRAKSGQRDNPEAEG